MAELGFKADFGFRASTPQLNTSEKACFVGGPCQQSSMCSVLAGVAQTVIRNGLHFPHVHSKKLLSINQQPHDMELPLLFVFTCFHSII